MESLVVIQLHFRAQNPIVLKHFSGFLSRGLFFNIISRSDPSFATEQHEKKKIAPYSCSPIMEETPNGPKVISLKTGPRFFVSFSILDSLISNSLSEYFRSPDSLQFKISNSTVELEKLKVFSYRYSDLMKCENPPHGFVVDFITPTALRRAYPFYPVRLLRNIFPEAVKELRSRYRFYPVPDPCLILRNLIRLWRKFSDLKLPHDDLISWVDQGGIVVKGFENLNTRLYYEHETTKKWIIGFTGRVAFSMPDDIYNEEKARITLGLMRFGEFVNLGIGRTAGFGMYRLRKIG